MVMEVEIRGRRLEFEGQSVALEADIMEVYQMEDRAIVLFDDESYEPGDERALRNIVAVSHDGEILWRVGDWKHIYPEIDKKLIPFTSLGVFERDGRDVLAAYDPVGIWFDINTDTGELSNPVQSKF